MMSRNRFAQLAAAAAIAWMASGSFTVTGQQRPARSQGPGRAGAAAGVEACGGRSDQPQVPCAEHVAKMRAVLPAKSPVAPKQPRKVLVYGRSMGYQHSSIPLAAKTIEELGSKTGAWTTDISYDPDAMSADNLKRYDAVFLSSTTGTFLDDPDNSRVTDARRR